MGLLDLNFFKCVNNIKTFLLQKFHVKKKFLQSLGGCQSWQLWNISCNYPLLVNLEYLFFNQSSSFEIWYTCCQHNKNFVSKISYINNNFLALARVSKLAAVWALSLELHKVPISVSPHCTSISVTMPWWWLIALTMRTDYHAIHCFEWELTDVNIKWVSPDRY